MMETIQELTMQLLLLDLLTVNQLIDLRIQYKNSILLNIHLN